MVKVLGVQIAAHDVGSLPQAVRRYVAEHNEADRLFRISNCARASLERVSKASGPLTLGYSNARAMALYGCTSRSSTRPSAACMTISVPVSTSRVPPFLAP